MIEIRSKRFDFDDRLREGNSRINKLYREFKNKSDIQVLNEVKCKHDKYHYSIYVFYYKNKA